MNFTKLGGRRFVIAMGAGMMTTVLQWFGKLDPAGSTYALVIAATVGAYIAGGTMDNKRATP
ncbi:hypothetical protein MCEMSHM24_02710 [Comamonadaceae bacterium]